MVSRVLILFGGRSTEHSISCVSAGSIMRAIDPDRYEVVAVGITRTGRWVQYTGKPDELIIADGRLPEIDEEAPAAALCLDPNRPGVWFDEPDGTRSWHDVDVAFPVLHGPFGEDGTIQGLFEIAGLPYVGSGVFSSAACMNKSHTKELLTDAAIPAGRWHAFRHSDWQDDETRQTVAGLGWPLFVKPARAGSSLGVSKATNGFDLDAAVHEAAGHDPHVIVEASVEGAREIECGVLVGRDGVPRASVCAEIKVRDGHEFYDFEAKYLDDSCDLIVPADLPPVQHEAVRAMAIRAFRALGCEGLARVDFFIAEDGEIVVNEINTMPGFTAISMYPKMWAATGVDYPELIDTLIAEAMTRRRGLR